MPTKSIPILHLDLETLATLGCPHPNPTEINEIIARMQAYLLNDETFKKVLVDAINQVRAKRDLF